MPLAPIELISAENYAREAPMPSPLQEVDIAALQLTVVDYKGDANSRQKGTSASGACRWHAQ